MSENNNSQTSDLTREDVSKVANLAMLNLTEEDLDKYTPQLASILDLASQMNSFDLDDFEPTAHPHGLVNIYREDKVVETPDIREKALSAAPDVEDNQFKVPPALGEEL